MSRASTDNFIVTREYQRFAEFCEACLRYRYIGLCYGSLGVGKTLSARRYANWDRMEAFAPLPVYRSDAAFQEMATVLYTPSVTNTPSQIERDIGSLRYKLSNFYLEPLRREEEAQRERVIQYERQRKRERETLLFQHDWRSGPLPEEPPSAEPTFEEIGLAYLSKRRQIQDPTRLVIVDEADRLRMTSLEQLRSLFDMGDIGVFLLGMPGLEKRLIRYPQFYSRVGFVHEFRPLTIVEVRSLLEQRWKPTEVGQSLEGITEEEALGAIARITGGNFRLLHRLLSQIARVMEINGLPRVTLQVVDAARESLVIGTV